MWPVHNRDTRWNKRESEEADAPARLRRELYCDQENDKAPMLTMKGPFRCTA